VTAAFFLSELRTAYPEQIAAGLEPHRAARLYYHAWQYPHRDPRLNLESVPATAKIDNRPWLDKKLAAFMEHKTQQHAYELFKGDVLLDYEFLASPRERRSPTRWSTISSPDCDVSAQGVVEASARG
jgi:hypothetical protein